MSLTPADNWAWQTKALEAALAKITMPPEYVTRGPGDDVVYVRWNYDGVVVDVSIAPDGRVSAEMSMDGGIELMPQAMAFIFEVQQAFSPST